MKQINLCTEYCLPETLNSTEDMLRSLHVKWQNRSAGKMPGNVWSKID